MRSYRLEFMVGLFMIFGMLALLVLALQVSGLTFLNNHETYKVTADFTNIGDLKVRAPVTIAGVTIGRVTRIALNNQTFRAIITLEIFKKYDHIPTDSTANVYTAGLIGSNYISIVPGFNETYLHTGSRVQNTNQAMILQNLIGQLMFSLKGKQS